MCLYRAAYLLALGLVRHSSELFHVDNHVYVHCFMMLTAIRRFRGTVHCFSREEESGTAIIQAYRPVIQPAEVFYLGLLLPSCSLWTNKCDLVVIDIKDFHPLNNWRVNNDTIDDIPASGFIAASAGRDTSISQTTKQTHNVYLSLGPRLFPCYCHF